jgi:hypothetical protein
MWRDTGAIIIALIGIGTEIRGGIGITGGM